MVAPMQRRTFALEDARSLVTAYKEIRAPVTLALYQDFFLQISFPSVMFDVDFKHSEQLMA